MDAPEEDLEEEQAEQDEEVEPEVEPPRTAPTGHSNRNAAKAKVAEGDGKGDDVPFSELSEAAKEHRRRRMCERKPSGKIHVPQQVHDTWLKGAERRALRDMLEQADGKKDSQCMFSNAGSVHAVSSHASFHRTPSCRPSRGSMRRSPSSGRSRSVSGTRRKP